MIILHAVVRLLLVELGKVILLFAMNFDQIYFKFVVLIATLMEFRFIWTTLAAICRVESMIRTESTVVDSQVGIVALTALTFIRVADIGFLTLRSPLIDGIALRLAHD